MDGKIVKQAIKVADYTIEEVAERIGLARETLGRKLNGEIEEEYVRRILKLPRIEIDDVIKSDVDKSQYNLIIVPIKAQGGFAVGYESKIYIDQLEKASWPMIRGKCFAFEVENFSMYKTRKIDGDTFEVGYKPGSHVIVTPIESLDMLGKNKDYVIATPDGVILKRFDKIQDNKLYLTCINEEYNPVKPIPLDKIKKVFFVEGKYQK